MIRNGILCLEGDWDEGLKRTKSLVPVLELVKSQWNIPYVHIKDLMKKTESLARELGFNVWERGKLRK